MGGDDIEIIETGGDSLILRKHTPDFEGKLRDCQEAFSDWAADNIVPNKREIEQAFENLFAAIAKIK